LKINLDFDFLKKKDIKTNIFDYEFIEYVEKLSKNLKILYILNFMLNYKQHPNNFIFCILIQNRLERFSNEN
jgi:hypothetical protein